MTIGLLILSADGFYVSEDGQIPSRPDWDKQFLLDICKDRAVLCSIETMAKLPASLFTVASMVSTDSSHTGFDINLGIATFKTSPPDLLLVTRSASDLHTGKHFRLEEYSLILTQGALELWTLNKKH